MTCHDPLFPIGWKVRGNIQGPFSIESLSAMKGCFVLPRVYVHHMPPLMVKNMGRHYR